MLVREPPVGAGVLDPLVGVSPLSPVTSRSERSETRKRERSGSLMVSGDTEAGLTRAEKKRKL